MARLAHLAQLAQLAQLAVLVLLVVGAPRVAGAAEPLENESEPGKAGAAGKPWKGESDLEELDLGTAGKGAAWTSWFNIDHPGGDGDHESLAAIRFYFGERVCARPLALEARSTGWELPAALGQVVHASPERGFRCLHREQPPGKACANYHVRFLCPLDDVYWSHWSAWSPCSRSACGSRGVQSRSRRCRSAHARSRLKELRCRGKATERRACSAGPCPEPSWTEWGAWGPCSRTCGGSGTRSRRRSCKPAKRSPPCPGRATEAQECHPPPCPGDPGRVPAAGCALRGTVVTAAGAALPDARLYLENRPGEPLARSDSRGRFTAPGLCPGPAANLSAHRDGFAPALAPIVTDGSGAAVAHLRLRRLEKPHMVLHPADRVREAGQDVTFCCEASGTPAPQNYSWYHNGTLLAPGPGGRLELRGLAPEQAGTYRCKATSEAGAILSEPAQLTVLAQGRPSCRAEPEPSLVELPSDCSQDAGGSRYYNVGRCPASPCPGGSAEPSACGEESGRCCGVRRMELRQVPCAGSLLPVKVVAECGCGLCARPRALVQGRVTAADTGEPLRFGRIFLGGRRAGFTGYQGSFTIEVPPDTRRLVARFVDGQQRLLDAVRVLPFDRRGGAVYQEVKMLRKKEPVELDGGRSNAIPLGEAGGREPVGELLLPAGAFLRPSGEVFNGTVKASVTFVDPRDVGTAGAASSDLSFADADGEIAPLRTYGMFAVDFREGDSGAELQAGPVRVRMDAGQVRMPEHLGKMKLWSLNPESGLWEEEGVLRAAGGGRRKRKRKREERTFLVGNLEIRERRLFNLDVPEDRRCFVKVRAYSNEKFNPHEQLEGVVVTLVNLEPQPGFPSNPRAWGRFDSAVTGPNGACLPAFCDGRRPDAYAALLTATLGGEELEAVASSPKLNPGAVGVAQPYLGKLGYRRSDHEDAALKKTAFQINVAKPDPGDPDESNGPVYSYRSLRECQEAPVSANHLRFYRVEVDRYEYNVVPFKESDVSSWTGDYLAWWPNPQEFRACFIKVRLEGPQEYMVRSRNAGGSHPRTRGQLYGLRDSRSVRDPLLDNTSGACVEFKCGGMLFDQGLADRTLVTVVPQGGCRRTATNALLRDYLSRHPPLADNNHTAAFSMLAPLDPLGHNYGIYTVTDQSPRLAKEIAIGRCFAGTSDGFSREMRAAEGAAVTFSCQERPPGSESLFQRLLNAPAEALQEIRREMGRSELRRAPPEVMDFASGAPGPTAARRSPGGQRRPGGQRGRP